MAEHKIYEVSQVNAYIKAMLDHALPLQQIFIHGEISNYKTYPSGHHYFTLKDKEGALRCVMFRSSAVKLRFRPENGMKVIASGRISAFPRDGTYQLYCSNLSPSGVGDLYVAFEQLKAKLQAEGLFDPQYKKPLPSYPQKIAVVTSSAGAAVHDIIRVLGRRFPIAKVVLLPVRVQGQEAPEEIVGALRYANRWKVGDLIITGRGGGSIEDLWAFNDERVAQAIFESELPIISAVGHEPDVTISDFVADVRAATPSHAAEIAVPDQVDLKRLLLSNTGKLVKSQTTRLNELRYRLQRMEHSRVLRDGKTYVQDKRMELAYIQQRLADLSSKLLTEQRKEFAILASRLDAMSPLKVLSRGYAVVQDQNGLIIKSPETVNQGDLIQVKLAKGELMCTVEHTKCREERL